MQQHKKGAHLLNKFKVTSLVGKIDSVLGRNFIDQVYIKYESIITTSYATTMRNLREAIKEKKLHVNAPVHTSCVVTKAIVRDWGFEEINHLLHSPAWPE